MGRYFQSCSVNSQCVNIDQPQYRYFPTMSRLKIYTFIDRRYSLFCHRQHSSNESLRQSNNFIMKKISSCKKKSPSFIFILPVVIRHLPVLKTGPWLRACLGVTFSVEMKVSEQCGISASKGNQILGLIRRIITYKDQQLIVPLYKAIVRPHLEYCNLYTSMEAIS